MANEDLGPAVKSIRHYRGILQFHAMLNGCFGVMITASSYAHIPVSGIEDRLMYFFHFILVQGTFAGFLYLLSLVRWLFYAVFPLVFVFLGGLAFWVYAIDISISPALLHAGLNTQWYILGDLVSLPFVGYCTVLVFMLFCILKRYSQRDCTIAMRFLIPISFLLIVLFFYVDALQTRSLSSKLPYSFFSAVFEIDHRPLVVLEPARTVSEGKRIPIKVVLVIGESVRADHLQLNGYSRATGPKLLQRPHVISFPRLYTNKTVTVQSLPQLLTDQSIFGTGYSADDQTSSYRSIFNEVAALGHTTIWRGNQLLEPAYRELVQTNDLVEIIDPTRSFYSFHKKKDGTLLDGFPELLDPHASGLFTLHMIGSHWWYEDKYPKRFRRFSPVVDSKYIGGQSAQQMINSYDNTLVYLDVFLDRLIDQLVVQDGPVLLMYVSDHGESLGEQGKWLHAHFKSLTNPGMLLWYSEDFQKQYPDKVATVRSLQNSSITADFLFHSILDLFELSDFDSQQSIFTCIDDPAL